MLTVLIVRKTTGAAMKTQAGMYWNHQWMMMAQPPSSCLGMTDLFGSLVINPIWSHGYGSTNNIKSPFYTSLYIDLYRLKMTWVNCHHFINISVAFSVGFPDVSGVFSIKTCPPSEGILACERLGELFNHTARSQGFPAVQLIGSLDDFSIPSGNLT